MELCSFLFPSAFSDVSCSVVIFPVSLVDLNCIFQTLLHVQHSWTNPKLNGLRNTDKRSYRMTTMISTHINVETSQMLLEHDVDMA